MNKPLEDLHALHDAISSVFPGATLTVVEEGERSEPYTCKDNTYLADHFSESSDEGRVLSLSNNLAKNAVYGTKSSIYAEMLEVVDEIAGAYCSPAWNESSYMVKVTRYDTGDVEVVAVEKFSEPHRPKNEGRVKPRDRSEMTASSLAASASRSKRTFTRRVMQMQAQHMLTGTTRVGISDREEFELYISVFLGMFRRKFPNVHYALVIEKHKSGYLHWHMAAKFHGHVPFKVLHAMWRSALSGHPLDHDYPKDQTPGNVDVSYPGRAGNKRRVWDTAKLARYIGKYLVKDIATQGDNRIGRKRYWSSKGVPKPEVAKYYIACRACELQKIIENIVAKVSPLATSRSASVHCAAMVGYYASTF